MIRKSANSEFKLNTFWVLIMYVVLSLVLYGIFLSPSKNLLGTDWLNGGYANWVFMRDYIREHHRLALWDVYIFSGMPTVAAFFPEILTLRFLSTFVLPIHVSHALGFIFMLTIAAISTYFFVRDYLKDDLTAVIAGVMYGFSGVLVSTTYAGHLGRLTSMALLPLYLLLLKKGIDSGKLWYFLLMGSVVGFSFLNGHLQMTYYGVLFLVVFFFFYNITHGNNLLSKKFYIHALYSILGAVVAALMYSFYLLPVLENLPYTARGTERGYEYAVSWSMPPEETLNLITPHFSGILDDYWGRNYFKLHTEYMGIITLFLALVAVVSKVGKDRLVRFLSIYALFVLFYVWGGFTPIYRLFYYVIPMVKSFRAPSLMFFIFNFISVFLASICINEVFKGGLDAKKFKKVGLTILGFFSVIFLIFLIFENGFIDLFANIVKKSKDAGNVSQKIFLLREGYSRFLGFYIISIVVAAVSFGLLTVKLSKRRQKVYFSLSLSLLVFLDLYLVNRNYIVDTGRTMDEIYGEDKVLRAIKEEEGIFRTFPLMYPRANDGTMTIHRIQSIGGYTSSPPRRYQEFIGAGQSVMFNPQNLIVYPRLLNYLDVKYVIAYNFQAIDTSRYDENTRSAVKGWIKYLENFKLKVPLDDYALYENPSNLGRIYFAKDYKMLEADSILELLKVSPPDSLREHVFLEKNPNVSLGGTQESLEQKIEILDYDANEIRVDVTLPQAGFLVFSENYHPGWKCYIDGKETEVFIANYAFRAVFCPEGSHEVVMKFNSSFHNLGFILSGIGFLISIAVLIVVIKKP
ncbi:MAG TPA: YfhO family protein [Candidatus Hydrothermia bacterium]|nr:YfhO family protein [Candidatus Hydrothermia bacterium]